MAHSREPRRQSYPPEATSRSLVYGVDFSGAADAGRRLWVTRAKQSPRRLRVETCVPGRSLPGSGKDRPACLAALRSLIAAAPRAAVGLDFPFSLPAALLGDQPWVEFVLCFAERFSTPQAFRRACLRQAGGREWKRETDRENRTPFSPYNLRLYRQTYYGVRDVLAPLVRGELADVLPMQPAEPLRPWLLEICPASTLKVRGLYTPYKGRSAAHRAARAGILDALETADGLRFAEPAARQTALEDAGGDALDSMIAALATGRALRTSPDRPGGDPLQQCEGRVFV